MKKFIAILLVLAMVVGLAACGTPANNTPANNGNTEPPKPVTLNWSIAGGASGGAYYIIHGGISDLLNNYSDGRFNTKVEVTGGSQENTRLVGSGECELGMTNSNLAYFGVQGTKPYTEKQNVKAVAALHSSVLSMVVPSDSAYQTIEDLKGKKVFLGPSGNGAIPVFEAWVGLYGLTLDDFECIYMEFQQGIEQYQNGRADAVVCFGGFPYSHLVQLALTNNFRHINFDTAKEKELVEKYPYYSLVTIPGGTYTCDKNDATVIAVANNLLINADISEEDAYLVAKILTEHLEELGTYHAAAKAITKEGLVKTAIDLHPGAAKYYKEIGLLK